MKYSLSHYSTEEDKALLYANTLMKDFYPWFLGAYGENHQLVEDLVNEAMRDHMYWRRNFHPESQPPIPTAAQFTQEYQEFVALLKSEMYRLSADLKAAIPFFSPRYIGHMASDLLIPGVVARIATLLYNPNHVSEDASPATIEKELEVGEQLAEMLGYSLSGPIKAFGHMTSGGTIANYEGLKNLMAARLFPVALGEAARELDADLKWEGQLIRDISPRRLANMSVEEALDIRAAAHKSAQELGIQNWADLVDAQRYETLGLTEFQRRHPELGRLRVMVPASAHYSWEKAMKLMGLGTSNLDMIAVDMDMRMELESLQQLLDYAHDAKDTVLLVVPVLGTTEFGAIDPVDGVVAARQTCRLRGQEFGIHLDAAWGGYLRSLFKAEDGTLRPHAELKAEFKYFPSAEVYNAFDATSKTDSATIDPHKLAFIPYPAGAYIARNRDIVEFVRQDAAYVFDGESADDSRFRKLGQYIMEGSKPGSTVASAYITHRVIPLNHKGFGKIIGNSIHSCEYFWDVAQAWAARMAGKVVLAMPFEPDTNIACFALNPTGNRDLKVANAFGKELLKKLGPVQDGPIQNRSFIVSSTRLVEEHYGPRTHEAHKLLGLDAPAPGDESLLVLRHTLMNPWLLTPNEDGSNYIDLYFEFLEEIVLEKLAHFRFG